MSRKKSSLSAALQETVSARPSVAAQEPTAPMRPATGRMGKKAIAGFFDPAVSKQLRGLGVERDQTVQQLLCEALNDLFEKYGRSRIA